MCYILWEIYISELCLLECVMQFIVFSSEAQTFYFRENS